MIIVLFGCGSDVFFWWCMVRQWCRLGDAGVGEVFGGCFVWIHRGCVPRGVGIVVHDDRFREISRGTDTNL